ncbi:MAG: type II toxin-antitoxin system VapC family toxin [Saprospiraceae bacterium]
MIIFLDTSSLFKLYHQEADSEEIEQVFVRNAVQTVFLSEITKLEFASTVWKKVRVKDLAEEHAILLKNQVQLAKTADKLLLGFFEEEGLQI